MDSNSKIPPMAKTRYIENFPTAVFTASTDLTNILIGLSILHLYIQFFFAG
jgi:hypothetical protein